MSLKYFGTDGIRGAIGGPIMNPSFIKRFAIALARYLRIRHPKGEVHLIMGRDTRASGEEFEKILIDNLLPYQISIDYMGVLPTPAIAYWVDELEADNGLVLTASHNPAIDNGIKLFNAHGVKQLLDKEKMIEALIDEEAPSVPNEYKRGEILCHIDPAGSYVSNVCEILPKNCLKGWKIVLDTANGSTCETSKRAFKYFGTDLIHVGNKPDGKNINERVGSEYPEFLCKKVKEAGARLGFAHDGDGDRVIVCDENGELVAGDQLLGILALHAIRNGDLRKNKVVATVHSNYGLDRAIEAAGGKVIRCDVGDRNVFQKMLEEKADIGGEPSGHYIFKKYAHTGDGLLSAIKTLEVIKETGKQLADLRKEIPLFPKSEVSLKIKQKRTWDYLTNIKSAIEDAKLVLGDNGYVLVRFSGTGPYLRILVQGDSKSKINATIEHLQAAARQDLDVLD